MAENDNTEKQENLLVKAAKTVGAAAGKVAAVVGAAAPAETDDKPKSKKGNYRAENLGSGTFLISKPKRKSAKRRQTALKGPKRGARK